MPYVDRKNGVVVGVFQREQWPNQEYLDDGHEDLVTYYRRTWRRQRGLFAIYQDIHALTTAQKMAIWTDLSSGSPPKWSQNQGPNTAAIMALHWSAVNSGATTANMTDARLRLMAMYVHDNPTYLVHPSFAPSINVPGDEPEV